MSSEPRVAYVPYSTSFAHPGDYGRFAGYASSRGLSLEIARWKERYDLVVLTEWADISVWRDYPHGKIVCDMVNSYLAIPRTDVKGCLRGVAKFVSRQHRRLQLSYWQAIRNMCRRSEAVVCTTETQRSYILPYCQNVHVVLDTHSVLVREVKKDYKSRTPFRLLWVGMPSNISHLKVIGGVLRELARRHQIELHVVTSLEGFLYLDKFWKVSSTKAVQRIFDRTKVHAWDEATCAKIITECDLAVIPVDMQDSLGSGKPENKLILLWRMGMPVVTSATPAYARTMADAGMSLTCKDEAEWVTTLENLLRDEGARRDTGERGRRYANDRFSEARIHEQWDSVFRSIGFDFSPKPSSG